MAYCPNESQILNTFFVQYSLFYRPLNFANYIYIYI